ncbi:MAG: hypothetical protein Q4G69_08060 [Planctomycetia bacterium]|nr:hypothetical protein [Planctomycetia bacterium]
MDSGKFSQHAFTIRERTPNEIADLALIIIQKKWAVLIFYFLVLALPCFLLNLFLFYPYFLSVYDPAADWPGSFGFFFCMILLVVFFESDFTSSLLTIWLGEWFFRPEEKIQVRSVFRAWFSLLPQIFYYLILFRIYFIFRSYVNEILLLEKPPFFKSSGKICTSKRVSQFQRGGGLESASGMQNFEFRSLFLYSFFGFYIIFFFGKGFLGTGAIWYPLFSLVIFPIYCWVFVLFDAVYTFLCYLNIRIIREGWDVDIAFKAEFLKYTETEDLITFSQPDLYMEEETDLTEERIPPAVGGGPPPLPNEKGKEVSP